MTDIQNYLNALFGPFDAPDGANSALAMRGLAEKGTAKEGVFFESVWARSPEEAANHARRWNNVGAGAFIVPAYVKGDSASIKDQDVVGFTSLLVDLDNGDTDTALGWAAKYLGQPSMVVASGGTTKTGHQKLHGYWLMTEVSEAPEVIARARKVLAAKVGGDQSFGRMPQVVRLPGSIHGKNNIQNKVQIIHLDNRHRYDADELMEKINEMPVLAGCEADYQKMINGGGPGLSILNGFNSMSSAGLFSGGPTMADILTSQIHEGGTDDTRWSRFGQVAGHYVRCVRDGSITLKDAKNALDGWVFANMVPVWPQARIDLEWAAIFNKDIKRYGPMEALTQQPPQAQQPSQPPAVLGGLSSPEPITEDVTAHGGFEGSDEQAAEIIGKSEISDWVVGGPNGFAKRNALPERKWLVRGLVPEGKPCLFVAEGGAGKSMLALDLAIKVSGGLPGEGHQWLGEPISDEAFGTVVFITAEDDKNEISIRCCEVDDTKFNDEYLIDRAGAKLIVLPLPDMGGSYPLVTTKKYNRMGVLWEEHTGSRQWDSVLALLGKIKDHVKLVIIDTLNATSHGDENNSTVMQQYFRQASRVCSELGATLLVTHHFRKPNSERPVTTVEDADAAVRGSGSIKNSVRQSIVIWAAHDYAPIMTAMGMEPKPKQAYYCAVNKANNREAFQGKKLLIRKPNGLLVDCTDQAKDAMERAKERKKAEKVDQSKEAAAWIVKAIEKWAKADRPCTVTGDRSLYGRIKYMHPMVSEFFSKGDDKHKLKEFNETVDKLINSGKVVQDTLFKNLDVPGGVYAMGLKCNAKEAPYIDWSSMAFDAQSGRIIE